MARQVGRGGIPNPALLWRRRPPSAAATAAAAMPRRLPSAASHNTRLHYRYAAHEFLIQSFGVCVRV